MDVEGWILFKTLQQTSCTIAGRNMEAKVHWALPHYFVGGDFFFMMMIRIWYFVIFLG